MSREPYSLQTMSYDITTVRLSMANVPLELHFSCSYFLNGYKNCFASVQYEQTLKRFLLPSEGDARIKPNLSSGFQKQIQWVLNLLKEVSILQCMQPFQGPCTNKNDQRKILDVLNRYLLKHIFVTYLLQVLVGAYLVQTLT